MNPEKSDTHYYGVLVKEFMTAFDQDMPLWLNSVPAEILILRSKLIDEEVNEYLTAETRLEQLDGLCDSVYVITGTYLACGIGIQPLVPRLVVWDAVRIKDTLDDVCEELHLAIPCEKKLRTYLGALFQVIIDNAAGHGFDLPQAFAVVHENNMKKLWERHPNEYGGIQPQWSIAIPKNNRWLVLNTAGKVVKPPDHTKPDLSPFV